MSSLRHSRPAALLGMGLVGALALGGCSASAGSSSASGAAVSGSVASDSAGDTAGDTAGEAAASPDAKTANGELPGAASSQTPGAVSSEASGSAHGTASSPADIIAGDKLVRTASMQLQVDEVEVKAAEVRRIAVAAGGLVTSENSTAVPLGAGGSTVDKSASKSVIALTVPSDSLDQVLDDLGKLGTTVQRTSSSRDVTATYVDTQSRVATMKAALDQLRALLTKTTDLGQVVSLETEISRRQADLDSLEAQLKALDQKVAQSTVTVALSTAAQPVEPVDDGSGFLGGLRQGWQAFVGASGALLTAVGLVLPFVLLVAVLGLPVLLWWRRRRAEERPDVPRQYANFGSGDPGSGAGGGSGSGNGGSGPSGSGGSGTGEPAGTGSEGSGRGTARSATAPSQPDHGEAAESAERGGAGPAGTEEVRQPVETGDTESQGTPVPV